MKEGWKYVKFKDVLPIKMGKTPPRADSRYWDDKKITKNKWVSISDISQNEDGILEDTKEYISDIATKNIYKVPKGSLLMSFKLSIGRMAFAGDELYTNEAIIAISENNKFNLRFLFYYLKSYNWVIHTVGNEKIKGATLNKKTIGEILLPIISLSEQEQIVSLLNSAFAKIDAVKANAEKSLDEAKALFQTALTELMKPKEGWEEKKLGDIFDTYSGGTPLKSRKEYYDNGDIPWLRSGEVCQKYITETELNITQKGLENSSAKYFPINTIAVAMYGATAAQVGIIKRRMTSNQAICGILPNVKYIPEFIYFWFTYKKDFLASQAQGGAQPNISQIKIRNLDFPILSLAEQESIVSRLDAMSEKVKALEANYKKTIDECDALKQAILRETFE